MENKKTWWQKLTVKNISTTCGLIIFLLVFLFTFLYTSSELKDKWVILLAVFGSAIVVAGIVWLVLALVVKKKVKQTDPNQQKIEQAIKKLEEEQKQDDLQK